MKKIALAALLAASLGVAHADVLTFEGLSTATPVPSGYGGLNWSNFYSHSGADVADFSGSGYINGLVSGSMALYNSFGDPATVSATSAQGFSLADAYFTGAWNNNLRIVATATFENGQHDSKTFFVNTSGPVDEHFNWSNLASVTFTSRLPRWVQTLDRPLNVPAKSRASSSGSSRQPGSIWRGDSEPGRATSTVSPIHCQLRANTRSFTRSKVAASR